ncbi:diguanylate cyclase [Propionivibrio sp.]|uniref:sensor domain-containing diguanylate cyclase n=1 Tax=Propionivibrio sp. TaxID=2212460 RepID=UPI0025D301CA|nr:diguanylate cyclase [Propionivibrio sp.]MBK8400318.1 diguanylate cyclase [Propionivibrio sp.]MBK8743977.1 diguanylate cyclase [Propionivibrio sp.]MBK8892979.1 diguanylate cyclase [Propionivibrio sp.]
MRFVDPDRYAALKATGKLPSPKGVALSIIRLLQRDDFRIGELVQLVQSDPAIAGRILYFANAAAFGRSRPIVSLQRGIVALGSFRVRDLVIGLSVMHSHKSGSCTAFDYEVFWGHSLATGIACQELAHFAQIASEEIFTIGLLARVGELALASLFPDEYSDVLVLAREQGLETAPLEQERFGLDHHELAATLLGEWGLPEVLVMAAFHHENPDAAGFDDGSRVHTLTLSLSFASALAHLCMVDEESRWSLLPALLARAARLGIGGVALNALVDRMVERWREWGAKLKVRTQDIPPFAEILAATPPMRRMGTVPDSENRRARTPCLHVQLIGIPAPDLAPLMQQIEELGHQPVLVVDSAEGLAQVLRRPAQIIVADLSMPSLKATDFCRNLRLAQKGKDCYVLLLATPENESRILEAIAAGADDVLVKPVNMETLRVHINTATRMQILKDEMQRERLGIMRSTDEFAVAQKRLLQDALTDTLTQLPNRRKGLDFLASEWVFAQSSGAPLACLMLDIDHFKRINDNFGHAAGDEVLRQLAEVLRNTSRSEDMIFRYGGEEFAAVLTNANQRIALQIGERIRTLVEKTAFLWEAQRIPVTLSVGVAVTRGHETDSLALIQAADLALYQAKEGGRNRVVSSA